MKQLALYIIFALSGVSQAQDSAPYLTLERTISLPEVSGRIDHMAADAPLERLFVAALGNNTLEVVDLKGAKNVVSVPGFAEPQGIAWASEFNRLFVANGEDGTCRILEGPSFKTVGTVKLGEDADNVRYDPKAKRIYVGYGSGALAVIDARTGTQLWDIKLSGHPESFRLETEGPRIFVNVPSAGQLVSLNRETAKVTQTWSMTRAKANFPMALDETNRRLFIGCRNPPTLVVYDVSAPGGQVVANLPIGRDTDDLFYDGANKLVYVSCGEGMIEIIRQGAPDSYERLHTLATAPGARTSLFIPELKDLCLAVPRRGKEPAEIRVYKTR